MASNAPATHNIDPLRQEFYQKIGKDNLAPLWEVLHTLVTAEPATKTAAHLWNYAELRPFLIESCDLITALEAERRVLVLENPALRGQSRATNSLFAGLQIIQPGEIAPPHRHMAAALRFVIEGKGAYTAVDGERTFMHPGDFVITPSWTWHDHGNIGDGPMVWLDGLDMHMVNFFETSFREGHENFDKGEGHDLDKPDDDSFARYGNNLLPIDDEHHRHTSPIFNYPYDRTRDALEKMKRRDKWDEWHGLLLKYVNPKNGDYAIPTLATFIQLLPKGFKTLPLRSTSSTVFVCTEGSGTTTVEGKTLRWGPRDIFVVPSWARFTHDAAEESVLFSYSDRGVQEKLGYYREQKFDA